MMGADSHTWEVNVALSLSDEPTTNAGGHQPTGRTVDAKPTRRYSSPMERTTVKLQDTILDATETVVARQGVASLTLDAVAAEARLSKGGLLHYFPSKDRLVEALVSRSAEN